MRKLKSEEIRRLDVSSFKKSKKIPLAIILDDVRSLNNIGSIFRTSDAFLIEKIYLCGITAIPPHKEIHKTALGATQSVDWEYVKDIFTLLQKLKGEGLKIVSVEQVENAIKLQNFKLVPHQRYAIVIGNEVKGVQQKVIDNSCHCIEIPQYGTKHSLNISVVVAIVVWDWFKKMTF